MGPLIEVKVGEHYFYSGRRYQVSTAEDQSVQLRTIDGPPMVLYQTVTTLRRAADQGRFIKIQEAPITVSPEKLLARLNEQEAAKLKIRVSYMSGLKEFGGRLARSQLSALIKSVTALIGSHHAPAYTTICSWRKAYLAAGGNCIALLPNTHRTHRRHLSHQPEEIKELIRQFLRQCYWVRTPLTKSAVIESISLAIKRLNALRPASRQYRIPSTTTLYRIICELDSFETACKQYGRRYAIQKNRWGAALPEPECLFERVEADTQKLHVFAADSLGRVIGRPYLTVFLEIKTRHVVGWYISFNPPSLDTTLVALKASINSDNVYAGVAVLYIFDNGPEYIAKALRDILELLGAAVSFCEPGEPNQKPHIEAFFKTWSTQIVHSMSGTTFTGVAARGDYNSEKSAIYTLDQIREIFSRWLDSYHNDRHSELEMSPNEAWDKCLENELEPRRYSNDNLRRCFWRKAMVTPSSQGRVRYSNVHWTGGAVSELAQRHPLCKQLELFYDPCDLGKAWICHPDYPMDLSELQPVHKTYQEGLTLHFHQDIHKRKLAQRKRNIYISAHEARLQLLWEISQTNNKHQRSDHHRALERGDVTPEELIAANQPVQVIPSTPAPRLHEYHHDTPSEFSLVRR
ncbi:hypothetical protein PS718_00539 [Pseudomonas fluorescens]|uniref:Integrase catalytic domain-containing protein n=1 Tax=Pseudomonas fluorescens TaxID=294 RepID=A0A5E7A221_PSEFL|nr:DDE-type integrase/transposase/recombinase [Pseudomonas fluorescens]VVN72948.1 hypothetical protein PS718_00539 [Pseudomonas fluorescens]